MQTNLYYADPNAFWLIVIGILLAALVLYKLSVVYRWLNECLDRFEDLLRRLGK